MKYQNNLQGNKVQCTICPRNCILSEGQEGFCHIRKNIDSNIVLTSYGYTTGLAIDPIEKKPLFHFYPGTKVLSFGTLGCNMGCLFCQNWQSSKSKEDPSLFEKASPEFIAQAAQKYGCKSVAFTYNDPTVFFEYAIDTAIECHKIGLKTVAVSAGYINSEPRKEFYKHMDAANIDLKAFNENFYKKYCMAHIEPILDTLKYIKNQTDCWLEITTLLIEGENDSDEELTKECNWIKNNIGVDTPLHFSAFHPAWKLMGKPATSFATLMRAYNIAKNIGLKHVYTGNIVSTKTSATYCDNCNKILLERIGHEITDYNITNGGVCKFCGAKCAGKFL